MEKNMNPESRVSRDQHFMENREIMERMVSIGDLKPEDCVLEIGPGNGNLTKRILKKGAKVTAVESDKRFKRILKKEFGRQRNLKIIFKNALDVMGGIRFNKIVSNLPYSICEPLINRLTRTDFDLAVLSVPEGFARILLAKPGEKNYSKLSLRSQSFFGVRIEFEIPKNAFRPEPKTESVVVVVRPLSKKDYRDHPEKYILKEIFLQGKKKLKNALLEGLINFEKNILGKDFTKNLAREAINRMDIKGGILEKKIDEMRLGDFGRVLKNITSFS
ncbi:MAG: ribosomal RNA small subunit methyltransferase A [Candidatus Aenigmarchaeota archaeon]|nr:ribosomal RNA small subunit methyltransferase A [Candidatus Aenigmarchaeota archaeon]NIP40346.1 ribosomal RNA small subunit methyltransferase A [Candidatus Aenigmarchaeota archaeon]NIQ17840.1 ribosomal RNA small subunit methyltransferase A [Candidatus Aenigmarchaeota archaeon]NIS73221.1 ribosomal RNA small subunit methyltransferase A [Candidatus Aenigmarchaeota archaeon]